MQALLKRGWNNLKWIVKGFAASKKWILAYVIIILIPASIMLYMYYQRSSTILEEEVTHSMLQTLKQAGINLNYQFDSVRDISDSISNNPNLYKYLSVDEGSNSIEQQMDVVKELRYLVDTAQTNTSVFKVRLFVDPNKIFADEHINFFSIDSLKKRSWYPQVTQANGSIIWTGAYLEHYIDNEDTYIISSARVLHDLNDFGRISGILLVDVAEHTVQDILAQIELSKQKTLYLVDSQGMIVYHADKSLVGTKLAATKVWNAVSSSEEGVSKLAYDKEEKYVVFTSIRSTGWKLVAEIPASEISRRAIRLNQYSGVAILLGVTVLFLLLVFMLLAFLVQGMNRRMRQVTRAIEREGMDHFDDHSAVGYGDYNLLERSVDRLIHKVKNLMEETYKSKMLEREAQLRALQAQINPHFLYNTLDTINWIAIGRNAHDISQMIDGLAKYFRLSLNKGRDLVSVTDELNLAKVYLEIQQSRFAHSFEFHIEAEPDLQQFVMPKLTLQPIVENALLHGIRKSKAKKGSIHISARLVDEELILTVTDDGIGMEPELADKLLAEPRPFVRLDGPGSSYGLYNVNERIKLYAGDTYGLTLRSQPDVGTVVTVTLKAIKEKRE